ncbi:LapA family protein [bacterium]|nr:LapA family protein [bacterium]
MRAFKIGFWALLTLGIVVSCVFFALQNNDPMTVTLFGHTTEVQPKWKVLLISSVVGAILSTIFFIIELVVLESKNIRLRRTNRRLMRAVEKYKKSEDSVHEPSEKGFGVNSPSGEPSIRISPSTDTDDV